MSLFLFYVKGASCLHMSGHPECYARTALDPLVVGSCEPPNRCWGLNPGPLEEQSVLLTPLSSPIIFYINRHPLLVCFYFLRQNLIILPILSGNLLSFCRLSTCWDYQRASPQPGNRSLLKANLPKLKTITLLPQE